MADRGLMVDCEKIETNIAHNVSCSLALTDLNYHLIFTVVDGKKNNDFTFIAVSLKISHAVYRIHYSQIQWWKWRFGSFRACLHEGGEPQIGEVTCGGLLHLTCKHDHMMMMNMMKWEIIWTGGLPHLSGLPHLPGDPHLLTRNCNIPKCQEKTKWCCDFPFTLLRV